MVDRSVAPKEEKSLVFNLPETRELELQNGIKLYFVQKEKLPIVYTDVLIYTGSKFDPSSKRGLSYLTSLLLDEGADQYDALTLSAEIEKLGSVLSVSSDHDVTSLTLLALRENFESSLLLLSKILLKPRFEEKDFLREKKKVLDRILQLKDEPSYIASSAFEKQVFRNSLYAHPEIGYENTVRNISHSDILEFYSDEHLSSDIKIIVVGNLTKEEAVSYFNEALGSWKIKNSSKTPFESPKPHSSSVYFVHKEGAAQSEIRVGHLAKKRDSKDYYAARIMNTILGGQFSSRITHNLREEKGFTYGASSSFSYYQDSAAFEVSTAVSIENTGAAVTEIFKELNGIRENITKEEIEFAKSFLIKQFPSRFETYSQVSKNIETLLLYKLPLNDFTGYISKIESVSDAEVLLAAVENIHPSDCILVVVGDREKIKDQLQKALGIEPVELDIYGEPLI